MRSSLYTLRAFQAAALLARVLPRRLSQEIACAVGRAFFAATPPAESALRGNLEPVTPRRGDAMAQLCRTNVGHFSRMLADYFHVISRPPAHASRLLAEWRGAEHLLAARERGRGVIVVTAHLGHWELGGTFLTLRGLPMTIVTLDEPTRSLTEWRDRHRQRMGIRTIPVGPDRPFTFVEMMQTLRRNECLAMLVDRPYPGTGMPVRMFDRATEFSSAPVLLAQHTGAAVIPAFVVRRPDGRYTAFAEPEVPMVAGLNARESLATNTQALASVFESVIKRYPEQWFNYVPVFTKP